MTDDRQEIHEDGRENREDRREIHELDAAQHETVTRQLGNMVHAAAFGEIVSILMNSPIHAEARLKDLARFVSPAIATRQYLLSKIAQKGRPDAALPVGVALWASVSDPTDERLRAAADRPVELALEEWSGGDRLWLVDLVCPAPMREAMLASLAERVAKGRPMSAKLQSADGAFTLTDLETLRASA
ncbi:MAG: toxin-activating lysine-acyltransferase [Pseudomonadota bacterium]